MAGYIGPRRRLDERAWGRSGPGLCCTELALGIRKPKEPMDRSRGAALNIIAAVCGLLALTIGASPAATQIRPVVGVLSPFVDADSTFLQDLREGLGERSLRE